MGFGKEWSTDERLTDWYRLAHHMADDAGRCLVDWFGRAGAQLKRDGSFVTEADLAVDQLVHEAVRAHQPDHALLSEEGSQVYQGQTYTWVVDPLDGTTNFANGLVYWGFSLALLQEGEPVLGVLEFPLLRQRFAAIRGQGAWLDDRLLTVTAPHELHGNHFFATDTRAYRSLDIMVRPKPRILGSAAYDLAAVASGTVVAAIETLPKIWDVAAAWLIVKEAGGVIAPLLAGAEPFPMQPGRDYAEWVVPVLAAANQVIWQSFRDAIHIKPGTERLAQRLAAQGWVLDLA